MTTPGRLPKILRRRVAVEAAADTCDMPVGYGLTCTLPGDHEDGCEMPLPPYSRKPITLPDGTPVLFWSGPATPTRPQRCDCGRPVPATSPCGCCCAEHDETGIEA